VPASECALTGLVYPSGNIENMKREKKFVGWAFK
jgi:hypothetical protein